MPKKINITPAEIIERYNPALGRHHLVTPEEWRTIGPLVRESVAPFTRLDGVAVYDYLRSMTKLSSYVLHGDGQFRRELVLAPRTIKGYLKTVKDGDVDEAPYLWRLSKEWGQTSPDDGIRDTVARPRYLSPYEPEEIDQLIRAAGTQSTKHRRARLLAIVVLGPACGIVRQELRPVAAVDVHHHPDGRYVRVAGRCAKVRPGFDEQLDELIALRPKGSFLGDVDQGNAMTLAHHLLDGRRGVPHLKVDRLRATYICSVIDDGANLLDVMAWSGLRHFDSLSGYLQYIDWNRPCPSLLASPT